MTATSNATVWACLACSGQGRTGMGARRHADTKQHFIVTDMLAIIQPQSSLPVVRYIDGVGSKVTLGNGLSGTYVG